MIAENRPGLELPVILLRKRDQVFLEEIDKCYGTKVVNLLIGSRSDNVGAGLVKTMNGGMGPETHWCGLEKTSADGSEIRVSGCRAAAGQRYRRTIAAEKAVSSHRTPQRSVEPPNRDAA